MKHIETSKQSKRELHLKDDTLPFTKTSRIPTLKNRVLAADQRHENAFRHEAEVTMIPESRRVRCWLLIILFLVTICHFLFFRGVQFMAVSLIHPYSSIVNRIFHEIKHLGKLYPLVN
jgi:hypothetical protein